MSEVEKTQGETMEVQSERPNSCEISVTAKGDITFKVKVYGDRPGFAVDEAQNQFNRMQEWVEEKKAAAQAKAQAA